MTSLDVEHRSMTDLFERIWRFNSRENLVTRVANALREQVESGQLASGVQLRGEVEFARELGVSRQTLREATRMLTREGLLSIRHGVGTFVAEKPQQITSPLESIHSLSSLIRESGGQARVEGLTLRRQAASAKIAKALQIEAGVPIVEITRLRLIDAKPLAIAYDYLPLGANPEETFSLIKTFDGQSIYQFMADALNRKMTSSEANISAVSASRKHADLLRVKSGFPLLLMREIQFDAHQRRGLYSMIYHNSSLMEFTISRPGTRA